MSLFISLQCGPSGYKAPSSPAGDPVPARIDYGEDGIFLSLRIQASQWYQDIYLGRTSIGIAALASIAQINTDDAKDRPHPKAFRLFE